MIETTETLLEVKKNDLERVKNEIENEDGIHCLKMVFRATCELEKNLLARIKNDFKIEKISNFYLKKTIRELALKMMVNLIDEIKDREPVMVILKKHHKYHIFCDCKKPRLLN